MIVLMLFALVALVAGSTPQDRVLISEGREGAIAGWQSTPRTAKARLVYTAARSHMGRTSACLQLGKGVSGASTELTLNDPGFGGKRLVLTGSFSVEGGEAEASLVYTSISVKGKAKKEVRITAAIPRSPGQWAPRFVIADIPAGVKSVTVRLSLKGAGALYGDDVRLRVLSPRPASQPSTLNVTDLVAFARLYSVVRYFHPSDESAWADWDALLPAAIRYIGQASDLPLKERLSRFFEPFVLSHTPEWTEHGPAPDLQGRRLRWQYVGYAEGSERIGPYVRQRTKVGATGPIPASDVPEEGLGTLYVPLEVVADANGTLPRRELRLPDDVWQSLPATGKPASSTLLNLASVIKTWAILRHFFPYWQDAGASWDRDLEPALTQAKKVRDPNDFALVLRKMLSQLRDNHVSVAGAEDGSYGPPIRVQLSHRRLFVLRSLENEARVKRGDEITEIDGVPVADALSRFLEYNRYASPQFEDWVAQSLLLAGQYGTDLTLTLRSAEGEERKVKFQRKVFAFVDEQDQRPAFEEVEKGIWIVRIDRTDDDEFKKHVSSLTKARGIVFDFRGYPSELTPGVLLGHLIDKPVLSPRWELPKYELPWERNVTYLSSRWDPIAPEAPKFAAKLAFVIDGRAVSYAESLLGIVEAYHVGELVGGPTSGTNGNVIQISLPNGFSFTFTGMVVLKHDGSKHHGVGIQPTVPVDVTPEGIRAGRDEAMERALEIVRG